ncbi:MAG TPA: hypothetical protein VMB46_05580 [Methanomassiliicoccales archaeon]|nr:hypothetical protein [Methanomassiliicoccales archaeon]
MDRTVASDTNLFNSGVIPPRGKFAHQFVAIGNCTYQCSIHTYMTGIAIVIA